MLTGRLSCSRCLQFYASNWAGPYAAGNAIRTCNFALLSQAADRVLQGKLRVSMRLALGPPSISCNIHCMCCPDMTHRTQLGQCSEFLSAVCLQHFLRSAGHVLHGTSKSEQLGQVSELLLVILSVLALFQPYSLHVLHSCKPKQSGTLRSPSGMYLEGRTVQVGA